MEALAFPKWCCCVRKICELKSGSERENRSDSRSLDTVLLTLTHTCIKPHAHNIFDLNSSSKFKHLLQHEIGTVHRCYMAKVCAQRSPLSHATMCSSCPPPLSVCAFVPTLTTHLPALSEQYFATNFPFSPGDDTSNSPEFIASQHAIECQRPIHLCHKFHVGHHLSKVSYWSCPSVRTCIQVAARPLP